MLRPTPTYNQTPDNDDQIYVGNSNDNRANNDRQTNAKPMQKTH